MKEYTPLQIEQTKAYLENKAFPIESVEVNGRRFSYFVLDPELNPAFPDFAFRMTGRDQEKGNATGIFGVSRDVQKELRPYFAGYEIRAFYGADLSQQNRFLNAEKETLATVPSEIRSSYIARRINFFHNAVGYFEAQMQKGNDDYTSEDIVEVTKVLNFLENQNNIPDNIPPGVFQAAETPEQIAAMRYAKKFGDQIIADHPEVADLYRDIDKGLTYFEIGKLLYPDLANDPNNINFLRVSVGYAVRHLIQRREQLQITRKRRQLQLEINMGTGGNLELLRQHQSEASQKRHALGIPVNTKVMIEARGKIPWLDEEKEILLDLIVNDPEYQIQEGQWKGKPNYELIAQVLNSLYHDDEPVRYANSVASQVRYSHRNRKK